MRVVENILRCEETFPHVVLTMGSFDGVHLGHQRILTELIRQARHLNGTAAVMTLLPHPREFFSAEHAPNLLTSHEKKLELFQSFGVDVVFVLPFNAETSAMDRDCFVREIVKARCCAESLVVGHDFCFGKDALGNYDYLIARGAELGFTISQVPPLFVEGDRVSSTLVRERLLEGDLDGVEAFLGRRYTIVGEVLHGRGIGMTLGFPTANIKPYHSAIPAQGVYAAEVSLDGQCLAAAVNIGVAPTIRNEDLVIEAFLLGFSGNIRGRAIEIAFHKRLRSEKKFSSREELMAAIREDVNAVSTYFESLKP